MPKLKLNAQSVKAIQPDPTTRLQIFDTEQKGLCLRVSPSGAKTWSCCYKRFGRMQRMTIGSFPEIALADARTKARDIIHDVAHGKDPQLEKIQLREGGTFGELVDEFLEKYVTAKKLRRGAETKRILEKEFVPELRHTPISAVTRAMIRNLVEAKAVEAPIMANRMLSAASKLFNWAISRDLVDASPCYKLSAPSPKVSRDRVLNDDEIRKLWKAFDAEPSSVADTLKLRLLTAQRGGEVLSMRWADIDMESRWWTIPKERSKNKMAHKVWIADSTLEILQELKTKNSQRTKRQGGPSEWVFPGKRKEKPLVETKRILADIRKAAGVENWKGHDLRRTAATKMTEAGIDRLTVAKVLNHAESGVTAVYDRNSYDKEKKFALDKWARRLSVIVSGLQVVEAEKEA